MADKRHGRQVDTLDDNLAWVVGHCNRGKLPQQLPVTQWFGRRWLTPLLLLHFQLLPLALPPLCSLGDCCPPGPLQYFLGAATAQILLKTNEHPGHDHSADHNRPESFPAGMSHTHTLCHCSQQSKSMKLLMLSKTWVSANSWILQSPVPKFFGFSKTVAL